MDKDHELFAETWKQSQNWIQDERDILAFFKDSMTNLGLDSVCNFLTIGPGILQHHNSHDHIMKVSLVELTLLTVLCFRYKLCRKSIKWFDCTDFCFENVCESNEHNFFR